MDTTSMIVRPEATRPEFSAGRGSAGCLLALSLAALSAPVCAQVPGNTEAVQKVEGELTLGGYWSDNIRQTRINPQAGEVAQVGAKFLVHEQSRRSALDLDVNAVYERYFGNQFNSGLVGGLHGSGAFALVPDVLTWRVEDTLSQGRISPFDSATPENRQNINYFRMGPDLQFRLSDRNTLTLDARYASVTYQVSPFDSNRYEGGVTVARAISQGQIVSLHARTESIKYKQFGSVADSDRREGFLRYDVRGERTVAVLDGGYTQVDLAMGKHNGALARLSLERELTSMLHLGLRGGWQITDAASIFRDTLNQTRMGLDVQSAANTTETVEERRAGADLAFQGRRTFASLGVERSTENYQLTNSLDRRITRVSLAVRRTLAGNLAGYLDGRYGSEHYDVSAARVVDKYGSLGLDWRTGRSLGVRLGYEIRSRSGNGPVIVSDEQRVTLTANWHPWTK